MPITLHIPITHRRFTDRQAEVQLEASTLGQALTELCRRFPALAGEIMDENNSLFHHMEVRVNRVPVFPWNPMLGLNPGDHVLVSSIIAGG